MENKLTLSQRSSLPENISCKLLIQILDNLETEIIIFDEDYQIRYFNNSYFVSYISFFENYDIEAESIIGQKLSDLKGPARDFVMHAIDHRTKHKKEFYLETDTHYSGFADLIPIETNNFVGTAVIQHQKQKLEELNKQLTHYKQLIHQLEESNIEKTMLPAHFQTIIGQSPNFTKALYMAAKVSKTNSSIYIFGESGSGKEVLADAIHYSSNYADGPFIKVNCASIPESLIESELFGYEKGAFTGANTKGRIGKLEAANHGTLFLDELGEMPKSMQAKLLRALQEHEITRIGGTKPIKLNFRLITATNRNLEEMVQNNEFREDLYYRICVIPIHLPALRERQSDIPLLAKYFLHNMNLTENIDYTFSSDVLQYLSNYEWPGNIRELKNCIERMCILCPDHEITSEYLPPNIMKNTHLTITDQATTYNLKNILEKTEYETLRVVLSLTNGNRTKAIEMLGISKRSFYMKLEKYGLR